MEGVTRFGSWNRDFYYFQFGRLYVGFPIFPLKGLVFNQMSTLVTPEYVVFQPLVSLMRLKKKSEIGHSKSLLIAATDKL